MTQIETDVLVVGTGPAGAAAAVLLSTFGIDNLVINRFPWTARTPRAHITNQRTMEVLRDLGLEAEAVELAVKNDFMGENPFVTSLAGEELGRIKTWGTEPDRKGDYENASPTMICDLPQNLMEPMLITAAAHRGSAVRFNTEYVEHTQDDDGVAAVLLDRLSGSKIRVRAKYMIGADGANSKVVEDLGLKLEGEKGLSHSMNMVFTADLSRFVAHRPSVLYWVIQPGSSVGGLGIGVVRMVRPWHKWLAIWGYEPEGGPMQLDDERATKIIHSLIGDNTIPIEIESTSTWTVNDQFATELSRGRVFCIGDAIHRHPPTNGLGSNTSIQDAFNLCWKLAYVINGKASPSLLKSFDAERAPVAEQIVKRANKSLGDFPRILDALGLFHAKSEEEMWSNMGARKNSGPAAETQRKALKDAINASDYVYNAHGVEMNQRYESAAIVPDGTEGPIFTRDHELYHQHSSRPGAPVPHARLTRHQVLASTLDLCGRGKFTVLTGINGEEFWTKAARVAADEHGMEIPVCVIGPGREYEDPYGDWMNRREIEEDGALLVRPDYIVAFRASNQAEHDNNALTMALESILKAKA
ncbi:MAG: FAD-dependent monooxygenase [Sphingomonadales bacterium]|nr:FAD-dependent monooxygenase [Sphingomonadales bacterium]